jgi:PAS domain S-box-containing protein
MTLRWLFAVAALALAATAGGVTVIATSNHDKNPVATATLGGAIGLAFVFSGLIARWRRPENRTGVLMMLVGFAWLSGSLADANNSYAYTLGSALGAVAIGFLIHLVLAFPSGRLETHAQRLLVGAGYVLTAGHNFLFLLFSDAKSSCGSDCPRNAILVYHDETIAKGIEAAVGVIAAFMAVALVVLLARRWRVATPALRRALLPVFVAGGVTLLAAAGDAAAATSRLKSPASWTLWALFLTVPLAFLFGLLRSRLAGAAVGRLLRGTPETPTPEEAQEGLRRALGDPTLELGFWLPARRTYVGASGEPLLLPGDDDPRVVTPLEDATGRPLAAVVHDAALLDESDLLEGVLAAARLAIQKDRLQAELHAHVAELQRERDFVATVVNTAPAFFCVLDEQGRIERFNDTLADFSGIPDDERVRGRRFWEVFVDEPDRESVREAFERGAHGAHEHRSSGGRHVVWRITRLPEGRLLASGIDLTARKRAEQELRLSRTRIVAAADEERRRLERNLHDGAQQRLVSLSLSLRLAQAKLAGDPDEAKAILDAASVELAFALEELRELARGLHPAVLADRGLVPALEGLAGRATLPVELDVVCRDRLPEQVEVAAFYVVAESLTNVAKYAHASSVHVRIEQTNGHVVVEIADDGVGGADAAVGTGLRGLADRVEALDGRFEFESPIGRGTIVRAAIPVSTRVPA